MSLEKVQRLVQPANQLTETLMTAAICANEMRSIIVAELHAHGIVRAGQDAVCLVLPSTNHRPLVDHSTLSLSWAGKTCYLGHTVLFRLAERLSRRPNQYITPDQLLRDVWEGDCKSPDTIRSTVRNLRQRLTHAGMDGLAAAIQGTGGRYGSILDGHR